MKRLLTLGHGALFPQIPRVFKRKSEGTKGEEVAPRVEPIDTPFPPGCYVEGAARAIIHLEAITTKLLRVSSTEKKTFSLSLSRAEDIRRARGGREINTREPSSTRGSSEQVGRVTIRSIDFV